MTEMRHESAEEGEIIATHPAYVCEQVDQLLLRVLASRHSSSCRPKRCWDHHNAISSRPSRDAEPASIEMGHCRSEGRLDAARQLRQHTAPQEGLQYRH